MDLTYNPNIDIPRPTGMPDFTKSPNMQSASPGGNVEMMAANMFMNDNSSNFMSLDGGGDGGGGGGGSPLPTIQGKGGTSIMDLGKTKPKPQYQANLDMRGDMGGYGGNSNNRSPCMYDPNSMYRAPSVPSRLAPPSLGKRERGREERGGRRGREERGQKEGRGGRREREREREENRRKRMKIKDIGKKKIKSLVNDINKSLDDYVPSASIYSDTEQECLDLGGDGEGSCMDDSSVPQFVKEFLIIVVIYVVLSQGFVRRNIGKYIEKINPDENGNVSIVGYIIYGAILAMIFVLFKRILM